MSWEIRQGHVLTRLREMPAESVHCCVTSPPYYNLRDYETGEWVGGDPGCDHRRTNPRQDHSHGAWLETRGVQSANGAMPMRQRCYHCGAERVDEQIGLEETPEEYVAVLVEVFREVRRALRSDGTLWLNIGDAYCNIGHGKSNRGDGRAAKGHRETEGTYEKGRGFAKHKDLLGIPWLLAFALRADGWYLRSDVIWTKPNPMPESVTDRPTSAHEHIFLLAKSARYFYDADAIRERDSGQDHPRSVLNGQPSLSASVGSPHRGIRTPEGRDGLGRNKRNVWEIATQPYADAHFATFPPKLVEPCVLAGSSPRCCGVCGAPWERVVERETHLEGNSARAGRSAAEITAGGKWTPERLGGHANLKAGPVVHVHTTGWEPTCEHEDDSGRALVLDPFAGAGTVGVVCEWHGRDFLGVELSSEYAEMARRRIVAEGPLGRGASRPRALPAEHLSLFDP